jgi:enoyl-CoA hydratase
MAESKEMSVKPSDNSSAVWIQMEGPVALVSMNRPDKLNAVNKEIHDGLIAALEALSIDREVRAVIITGVGKAFCAGGDVDGFGDLHNDHVGRRMRLRGAKKIMEAFLAFPLPLIGAVNGPAIGLGASIVACCDIVLMADDAFLSDPHVSVGLVAGDGGAALWPLMMSILRAKEYLLTGDRIPAPEALRLGLANRVVAPSDLMTKAREIASRLAAQPPQALQETKRILNMHLTRASFGVIEAALNAESESFLMPEHHERRKKFLEGRRSKTASGAE